MKIGIRTLKTAIGVTVSVWLAHALHLEFYTSAGILTLLCIQKTRKESLSTVLERLYACIAGLVASGVAFGLIGYHPIAFLPIFLLLIPFCVRYGLQGGIASSCVVMMHTYVNGRVDEAYLLNEFAVIAIGLGVALLVNMYMPGIDKQVQWFKTEIDRNMRAVLYEFAKYMKEGYGLWDGKEMLALADLLRDAKNLAVLEVENNLTRKSNPFYHYLEMKQQQFHVLERMLPLVSRLDIRLEQGVRLGEFIEDVSRGADGSVDPRVYEAQLRAIREQHKQLPMPQTRSEFENRAILYTLANELEGFIRKL